MTNYELGKIYLQKAEKMKEKIEYLQRELKKRYSLSEAEKKDDIKRRLRLHFEMYLDLKSIGEKLMGGKEDA